MRTSITPWRAYRRHADSEKFVVLDANGDVIAKIDATSITRTRRWNDAKMMASAHALLSALSSMIAAFDTNEARNHDRNPGQARALASALSIIDQLESE